MPRARACFVFGFALATGLAAAPARAQGDTAAAQALFEQARKLMSQGKYADACPKFADSEKLDPAPGTMLNLANCYEKNGQTASAWATYKSAESVSKQSGHKDWAQKAHDRAAALEPSLSRLTITVPPTSEVEGLQITNDGNPVARSEWNTPIPTDPGKHTIEATAPNTRKWQTQASVDPNGAKSSVTIPQLEVERTPTVATPAPQPETTPASDRMPPPEGPPPPRPLRYVGIGIAAVGVVGLGVGTVFGLIAKSKNDTALNGNCATSTLCSPQGLQYTDDAKHAATISTIAFAAGGALVIGGVLLAIFAPAGKPPSQVKIGSVVPRSGTPKLTGLSPWLGPQGSGMAMEGAW